MNGSLSRMLDLRARNYRVIASRDPRVPLTLSKDAVGQKGMERRNRKAEPAGERKSRFIKVPRRRFIIC